MPLDVYNMSGQGDESGREGGYGRSRLNLLCFVVFIVIVVGVVVSVVVDVVGSCYYGWLVGWLAVSLACCDGLLL